MGRKSKINLAGRDPCCDCWQFFFVRKI